jgi:hypothetical protein
MAITFVQAATGAINATVTTGNQPFGVNVTINDLLIAMLYIIPGGTNVSMSCTDSQGNSWSPVVVRTSPDVNGNSFSVWTTFAKATGANTITWTVSPAAYLIAACAEYSGWGSSTVYIDNVVTNGVAAPSLNFAPFTINPRKQPELVGAFSVIGASETTSTFNAPFTIRAGASALGVNSPYGESITASLVSQSFSGSTTTNTGASDSVGFALSPTPLTGAGGGDLGPGFDLKIKL